MIRRLFSPANLKLKVAQIWEARRRDTVKSRFTLHPSIHTW